MVRWVHNVRVLVGKEMSIALVSPLPYVLAGVFCALCGFFFVTRLILFTEYSLGRAVMENFWFGFLAGAPYSVSSVLVFVIPLLTMRAFAEERRLGTLELLLTFPVRDSEVVFAKFAAAFLLGLPLIGIVAAYAGLLSWYVPLPWPMVLVGLLGLLLLVLSCAACGVFFSSLTDNQVVAALGSMAVLLVFWFLNWNEAALRSSWLEVVREVSAFDHFEALARGMLAVDDVAYFLVSTAVFQFLTERALESRRWRRRQ
jgi:ABC-2 type transport system permease protein